MKTLVFIFNLLICIVGAVLMGVSLWANLSPGFMEKLQQILDQNNSDVDLNTYKTAIWVLVGIGGFVFLVGFLGCCGAACESRLLLILFIIIITILFIAELATGIYALVSKNDFKDKLHKAMQEAEKKRPDVYKPIEDDLKCCGVDGKRIPASGGQTSEPCKYPNGGGCFNKIWSDISTYSAAAGGVAIGLLVIEALAIVFACCLCSAIGRTHYYS
jgi:hypothetical protein